MKILVCGATGRVGASVVEQALAAGHEVVALVRDAKKLQASGDRLKVVEGDATKPEVVEALLREGCEAVVMAIGAPPRTPSTVVADATRAITQAMQAAGVKRYLAVSGTAEMPQQTWLGRVSTAILRMTPVGPAVRDHDAAFRIVQQSGLEWTLAACPHIADGAPRGYHRTSAVFPGGYLNVHPTEVARFLVQELEAKRFPGQIVGVWN
ncbi:MAG: NAD(P)H-binding protein [Caulobacterales bacterium]|nr:NAD(P)H-binding protein [Caulobacterales bacterium]